jgi:hypothetical protein
MDKSQKKTDATPKTGTSANGEKEGLRQDPSSKKMMDGIEAKSKKGMNASFGKSPIGIKTSKGK